jgi:tripartite-type tricarboxylate transporter receptor subunit TctC
MMGSRHLQRLYVAFVVALASLAAQGAEVLKLIIPTPPGGGTDGYFRVLVREAWG